MLIVKTGKCQQMKDRLKIHENRYSVLLSIEPMYNTVPGTCWVLKKKKKANGLN